MAYGSTLRAILGGEGGYRANGVTFDGSSTYLSYGSTLLTNSKQLTGSFWFRMNSLQQSWFFAADDVGGMGDDGRIEVFFDGASGPVRINARNSSGTDILEILSSPISDTDWHHCCFSVDLDDTAKRHLYIDGATDLATVNAYSNDTIAGADADSYTVGANIGGASLLNGDLADFWITTGQYVDLSVAANLEKFIKGGKPVNLDGDGSAPTGASPIIFLQGETSAWHTNKGTGSGFTENGTLTTASTSPSD